jgi:hypothetical protein
VVITVGELVYRWRDTKDGEKSRLEILVWRVQKDGAALATASVATLSADHAESESPTEPPVKVRRPRAPKLAQQPWIASRLNSDN